MSSQDEAEQQPEEFTTVDKDLEDIMENEKYDSDELAKAGTSSSQPAPSSNGSVSSLGSGSKAKRRTWKKPKDKPKRPLSAYNIFFKHERSRIVEGKTEPATPEEAIRSIENILSTSRETRRHRKTHGRISFGDLARKIADKWKSIGSETKAVFEHYAELDMRRYRKEVKLWKERKESEAFAKQGGLEGSANSMSTSFSSVDSDHDFVRDAGGLGDDAWNPRRSIYDSMNSSFSSACSADSENSLEPIPIGDMLRNARPNMHASMPNLNMEIGGSGFIPGGDSSQLMGNYMDQNYAQYGQQSLSNLHYNPSQGVQIDSMGPPMMISSSSQPTPLELQQLREQNSFQQRQLQRQQQILIRQQQLLQQQIQHTTQMMNSSVYPSGPPGSDPLPYGNGQGEGNGNGNGGDLENYLSNLDLSNI